MAITAKRDTIEPIFRDFDLELNDVIVLCSDGLWGPVPDTLIWAAASELPPQAAADKLISLANASRGPDNISVIVARRVNSERTRAAIDLEDTNPGR